MGPFWVVSIRECIPRVKKVISKLWDAGPSASGNRMFQRVTGSHGCFYILSWDAGGE